MRHRRFRVPAQCTKADGNRHSPPDPHPYSNSDSFASRPIRYFHSNRYFHSDRYSRAIAHTNGYDTL